MAMSASDRWVESETRAELDVRGLTDSELSNLARYRAVVAVNTVAGHSDHQRATERLSAAYGEIERRQQI
jgi:hypothetical protein